MLDGSLLEGVLVRTASVVGAAGDVRATSPTPCPGFDLAGLVAHMADRLAELTGAIGERGERVVSGRPDALAGELVAVANRVSGDPAGDWAAAVADRAVVEYVAHGWDLAVATGRAVPYTAAEAAGALRVAPHVLAAEVRGPGCRFGPVVAVPHSAPPIDRFVGLTGRRPGGAL